MHFDANYTASLAYGIASLSLTSFWNNPSPAVLLSERNEGEEQAAQQRFNDT